MLNALVVEDERDIRQLLAVDLDERGYQVQEAHNGEIGLLACQRTEARHHFRGYHDAGNGRDGFHLQSAK